jgi:hypothetical protein
MSELNFKRRIFGLAEKFHDLRESKVLSHVEYSKQIIILASELAKEDFNNEALSLLLKVEPSYFINHQHLHAEDDVIYKNIVLDLADRLETHIRDTVSPVMPNVPSGEA